jgi:hypothetical protein
MVEPQIIVCRDAADLSERAAEEFVRLAGQAVPSQGRPCVSARRMMSFLITVLRFLTLCSLPNALCDFSPAINRAAIAGRSKKCNSCFERMNGIGSIISEFLPFVLSQSKDSGEVFRQPARHFCLNP